MRNHGVVFKERRDLLREKILMMKELWTQDEASYAGDKLALETSWAWPKPTQQPHPPIVMGGAVGPKTAAHIAEFCDGWLPLGGAHARQRSGADQNRREAVGRDGSPSQYVQRSVRLGRRPQEASRPRGQTVISHCRRRSGQVLPLLDKYAKLIG